MSSDESDKTIEQIPNYPLSNFPQRQPMTYLSKLCTKKQRQIEIKTNALVRYYKKDKDNGKGKLMNGKNTKLNEGKRMKMNSLTLSKNKELTLDKIDGLLKQNYDYFASKAKQGSMSQGNLFKNILIKNRGNAKFNKGKCLKRSHTSGMDFITAHSSNNNKFSDTSINLSVINQFTHFNSFSNINKRNLSNSNSYVFNQGQSNHSSFQNTVTFPLKAKYKIINDTLTKSVKESNRLNRNLNFYMNKERNSKVPKSFPKLNKSKKELELEGKYEELNEKMTYNSKTFKGHYIAFKNKRTGDYHIIRSGFADLMKYIDNYAKMEDGLFFKYKKHINKMYPIIQEAADIKGISNDCEKNSKHTKGNDAHEDINNIKDLSSKIKKISNLSFNLQSRKNKLFNRLNDNIEMNNQISSYKKKVV